MSQYRLTREGKRTVKVSQHYPVIYARKSLPFSGLVHGSLDEKRQVSIMVTSGSICKRLKPQWGVIYYWRCNVPFAAYPYIYGTKRAYWNAM